MSSKKLGRYELIRVLGRGAMGIVYEGRDPNLDRRVAIKTVKVEELPAGEAANYEARFRTEARSAARLAHPNIVTVHDWDRDGNIAFLVMEYVQGHDLKHDLDRGPGLSLEATAGVFADLLSALAYAHERGIVHRDIKPANLLVDGSGRVKLTDFGVARIQDSGDLTRTQGSMIGTLKYMAPEQVQGLKVDARADLFSAGVVLYQLLTNRRPFDADNDFSIIQQIISSEPPPPGEVNPGLGTALDEVVARALAKDREQRFQSADAFAQALREAVQAAPDRSAVPPPAPRAAVPGAPEGEGPGSSPAPSSSPGLRSSITQELELVYWKDVRETSDPEELESFLAKFPQGIYADLARKRLARLRGGPGGTDATVLAGLAPVRAEASVPAPSMAGGAGAAPAAAMDPAVSAGVAAPAEPMTPPGPLAEAQSGPGEPAAAVAAFAPEAVPQAPGGVPARQPEEPQEPRAPQAAAAARANRGARRPGRVFAVLAAVLLAAVAAWWGLRPGPAGDAAPAVAGAPAPAAGAVSHAAAGAGAPDPVAAAGEPVPREASPAPLAPAVAGTAAVHPAAASSHNAARAGGSAPRKPREPALAAAKPDTPVQAPASTPGPSAVAVAGNSTPAPARDAARQANWSAVDACRDRLFLMRELCLVDACGKPGTQAHPLCIQHREEVRVREASRGVGH